MDKWIEIKTRPLTEEEKELFGEDFTYLYDCELPNDGDEVLITTKYGYVAFSTFYNDDCAYFEGYEDDGEVVAWRPLPEPYQKGGAE